MIWHMNSCAANRSRPRICRFLNWMCRSDRILSNHFSVVHSVNQWNQRFNWFFVRGILKNRLLRWITNNTHIIIFSEFSKTTETISICSVSEFDSKPVTVSSSVLDVTEHFNYVMENEFVFSVWIIAMGMLPESRLIEYAAQILCCSGRTWVTLFRFQTEAENIYEIMTQST